MNISSHLSHSRRTPAKNTQRTHTCLSLLSHKEHIRAMISTFQVFWDVMLCWLVIAANVMEVHAAWIFRVKQSKKSGYARKYGYIIYITTNGVLMQWKWLYMLW
jgi:hypothetical protein